MCEFLCCSFDLVKECCGSAGDFFKAFRKPCEGTSVIDALYAKGNEVNNSRMLIVVGSYFGILANVAKFFYAYQLVTYLQSQPSISISKTQFLMNYVTQQILPSIFWTVMGAWLNYFAIVKKLGCIWCFCCCCEGSTVMMVLAILNIVGGILLIYSVIASLGVVAQLSAVWSVFLVLIFQILQEIISLPLGLNMFKLAQDPKLHESHLRGLQGESEEGSASEPESSEA